MTEINLRVRKHGHSLLSFAMTFQLRVLLNWDLNFTFRNSNGGGVGASAFPFSNGDYGFTSTYSE